MQGHVHTMQSEVTGWGGGRAISQAWEKLACYFNIAMQTMTNFFRKAGNRLSWHLSKNEAPLRAGVLGEPLFLVRPDTNESAGNADTDAGNCKSGKVKKKKKKSSTRFGVINLQGSSQGIKQTVCGCQLEGSSASSTSSSFHIHSFISSFTHSVT